MDARIPEFLEGWRGLRRFWMIVLAALGTGAAVLQLMGAPPVVPDTKALVAGTPLPIVQQQPGRTTPGAVADPDPALLETNTAEPDKPLPRVSADGRTPMHIYASGFDSTAARPRVGMVIAGIGMNEAASMAAIRDLPAAVTLAVSPYAGDIGRMLSAARGAGHEYLLSIPMEPQGYPINDPDDRHALMASLPVEENVGRLRWVLSRIAGYAGVTSALGPMHGERLAGDRDQFESLLQQVAQRGLLFVDARVVDANSGQPALPLAWSRSADVVIDEDPVNEAALDARLDALSKLARDKGSALGLVSLPRPKTLERVAAWSNTLTSRGLILAPVSALVQPPARQELDK